MYSTLKRKTRLNPISARRKRELPLYLAARAKFLEDHPKCALCDLKATDIHHKKRRGKHYLETSTWMAVCRFHHMMIHDTPKWAREHGYLF